MAIIYSYPHATPTINDMVLGTRFREIEGISTNSFYISDLATIIQEEISIPTLQDVTDEGDTTTNDITANTFSTGTAKVWDDGTIEGTSFQFNSLLGSLQSAAQDNKAWLLPDESGTIALTKYKVYTAILTQTGTAAPVATVLENTLGGAVTFSRTQAGQYNIISSAKFGNTPPFIILGSNRQPINVGGIVTNLITRYQSSSYIDFWSMNSAYNNFIEGDGAINNLAIEIRVYN
jgi:hypothetical protein